MSLKIFILNIVLVLLSVILLVIVQGNQPGAIKDVAVPGVFYIILSFVPALIGLIIGVVELIKKKRYALFGVIGNLVWSCAILFCLYLAGRYA